jgi:hypothetical protein
MNLLNIQYILHDTTFVGLNLMKSRGSLLFDPCVTLRCMLIFVCLFVNNCCL